MDRVSFFTALAIVAVVWAYVPYIRSILSGTSRPTLSTWLSWLIVDAVILAGMIAKDSIVRQMYVYFAGTGLIVILCGVKKVTIEWKKLDSFCFGLVILALVGWYFSGNANVAITISVVANIVGSIPMLINLWKDPRNEPLRGWLYGLLAATLGVLAIPSMTIAYALTPIAFFFIQSGVIILILRRQI